MRPGDVFYVSQPEATQFFGKTYIVVASEVAKAPGEDVCLTVVLTGGEVTHFYGNAGGLYFDDILLWRAA